MLAFAAAHLWDILIAVLFLFAGVGLSYLTGKYLDPEAIRARRTRRGGL